MLMDSHTAGSELVIVFNKILKEMGILSSIAKACLDKPWQFRKDKVSMLDLAFPMQLGAATGCLLSSSATSDLD